MKKLDRLFRILRYVCIVVVFLSGLTFIIATGGSSGGGSGATSSGGGSETSSGGLSSVYLASIAVSWNADKTAAVMVDVDGNGMIVQEDSVVFLPFNGEEGFVVYYDENNLPVKLVVDGNTILYGNWRSSLVDIAVVSSEGIYTLYRDVQTDSDLVSDLTNLASTTFFSRNKSLAQMFSLSSAYAFDRDDLVLTLRIGGKVLSAAICVSTVISAIASGGVSAPVIGLACASTAVTVASILTSGDNKAIEGTGDGLTLFSSVMCDNPLSCAAAWMGLAGLALKNSENIQGNHASLITEAEEKLSDNSDTVSPLRPTGFSLKSISSSAIDLSWNEAYDMVGVIGYRVYRDGKYILSTSGTSIIDVGLDANKEYCYHVVAIDAAVNVSGDSEEKCAVTFSSVDSSNYVDVIIQPDDKGKDAYISYSLWSDGTESYSGFGDTKTLRINYEHMSNRASEEQGLIKFPLEDIPMGATIYSAKLKLYGYAVSNYVGVIPKVYVSGLLDIWDESTVSWDTKPGFDIISSIPFVNEGSKSWYEWNVKEVVQGWVDNPSSNFGFGILFSSQNDVFGEIYSGDNDEGDKRPKLEIVYLE